MTTTAPVRALVGLRQGELLALRWPDVDLEGFELHVRGTLRRASNGGGLVVDSPKTSASARTVPLGYLGCDAALTARRRLQAAERLAAGPAWQDTGHVFMTPIGTPVDPRNALRWWHDLTTAAGVGRRRMHASRHTAATALLEAGVPLEVVSAVLGHASLAITADVYARVTGDAKRRALAQLEAVSSSG